jgi:predicted Zn-dependent peptidase
MPKIINMSNGIKLVTQHMAHTESVSISVWVGSGSRHETIKNNGISHFLEHMAFKGTKRRSARQIAEEFDNIGGYFNAHTGRETTVYYAKTLKDDAQVAVDILADIIQNSVFDEEELERERGVILQELAMTIDTPDDIIFDYFQEMAYPKQAVGRSILGTESFINKVQKADFIEYISKQYVGENIVIAVAGNIEGSGIEENIQEQFSIIKSGGKQLFEKAKYVGGEYREKRDLEQVHVLLGFDGINYKSDEIYKVQLLSIVLGGGMSSRLFQEVREKRGLSYSISSFNSSYADCGLFNIYAGTAPEKANELLQVVSEELKKCCGDIEQKELDRAKAGIRSSLLMAKERSGAVADDLGRDFTCFGRNITIEEHLEKIASVNVGDLSSMMERIITGSKPTFAVIGDVDKVDFKW